MDFLKLLNKKAPSFSAVDQNGQPISLKDYVGKKLALYFYPNDSTPTCTVQACNIRDNFSALKKKGITVVGVSINSQKSHEKFVEKNNLPFTLVVDEDKTIVNKYGVWGEKLFMGKIIISTHRITFLIDEKGKIVNIIDKVKSKIHAQQILEGFGMAS